MNTFASRSFFLGALMLSIAVGSWSQGVGVGVTFKASAPFTAGETKFPAGTYTITQDPDSQTEFQINNDSSGYGTFVSTEPGTTPTSNQKLEVTFQKYGDNLVLKAFTVGGANYVVPTSYAEKKASKAGSPSKVSVPANKK